MWRPRERIFVGERRIRGVKEVVLGVAGSTSGNFGRRPGFQPVKIKLITNSNKLLVR